MVVLVTTLLPERPGDLAGADALAADVLELRLDGLDADQVATAVGAVARPVLASCRRHEDGGQAKLDEDERHRRLSAAVQAGASLVDVEQDAPFREALTNEAHGRGADVVVSHHDLEGTPDPSAALTLLRACRGSADIVKLATKVNGPTDVQALFETSLRAPTLGVPFAVMGVGDSALRASAGPLGMALVYTAPGSVAVPGQLAVGLQRALPRAPPPPEGFRDYVLLGEGIAHSLSPRMQNAAFSWLGEPARYRPLELTSEQLARTFDVFEDLGVAGGNVTSPHKGSVFERCAELTPAAEEARAVNTFRFEGGRVHGHTTDGLGAIQALAARGHTLADRRVVVVGAGGTARAAAHAFVKAGAEVVWSNRTASKAERPAKELGTATVAFDETALADALTPGSVLFNATPVDLPIADDVLAAVTVFDATYGPRKAALARRAELAGARALDGLDLLVHQGDLALRFWLDLAADQDLLGVMSCAARTGALEARYGRDRA